MTALLLEPHNDDAVLFASWTCLRYQPHVVTVLKSRVQEANGITAAQREHESIAALAILGCRWEQWYYADDDPVWTSIGHQLRMMQPPKQVFAPWPDEPGAHDHHREIGKLALEVFGPARVKFYCTYRVGGDKTRAREVPYENDWIEKKHRALACYRSQMEKGPRRLFMMDLHEYEPDL